MPGRAGQVQDGDVTWGCGTKARDRDIPAAAHQLELGGWKESHPLPAWQRGGLLSLLEKATQQTIN